MLVPDIIHEELSASAGSRDLFCNRLFKMLNILAREIGTDTPDEFCFAQEPIRFGDCPLGVDPLWLDSIQPRALDGQLADQDRTPPSRLARRLWARTHERTSLLTCQLALSHTNSSAFLPSAFSSAPTQ